MKQVLLPAVVGTLSLAVALGGVPAAAVLAQVTSQQGAAAGQTAETDAQQENAAQTAAGAAQSATSQGAADREQSQPSGTPGTAQSSEDSSQAGSPAAVQGTTQASRTQAQSPATADLEELLEEFRPRLPMCYAPVVDDQQREQIYAIQREYWPRIELLRRQLEALQAERDAKIEAVLTPEQLAEVQRARAEAFSPGSDGSDGEQTTESTSSEE